jgi:hypothetical protein
MLKPRLQPRRREARRVDREVYLYRLERQAALDDQIVQDLGERRIFEEAEDRALVRGLGDEAALLGGPEIGQPERESAD